jgi:hypothetical protein
MELYKKSMSKKDMISYRIKKHSVIKENNSTHESIFSNSIHKNLNQILCEAGFKVLNIGREYTHSQFRFDFFVELEDNRYLIIEVKYSNDHSSDEQRQAYAVGQLLSYKTVLSIYNEIPKENIDLMLIVNKEFILPQVVINYNDLPINYLVYGDDGVKLYGR